MRYGLTASRIIAAAVLSAAMLVSSSAAALDWPFRIQANDTIITIYMPQIETFEGDMVTARAAVSISVPSAETPVFGAIWFESYALTDRETRVVVLSDVDVLGARFPSMEGETLHTYRDLVDREVEEWEFLMTMDDMKAALEYVDKKRIETGRMQNDPPKIYFRSAPAVLVTIDGEPKERDLEDSDLEYVVNTAFFIVRDRKSGMYYLRGGPWWFASRKAASGYAPVEEVPGEVADLAEAAEKAAAEAAASEESEPADTYPAFEGAAPPEIIISTEPAELIVSEGEPDFAPVEGTDLLYMTNTDFDVFIDTDSQLYFTLISGRWYSAPSMEGGWEYIASDALPEGFAKIPPESDNGHVLASIAGTEAARDAVLDMYVPQTAEVDRKMAGVEVGYDGDPEFGEIEDTDMTYAVNTSSAVIRADGSYYCCDEAVWFVSAAPTGPWTVCVEVPDAIYTIPPSCPVYNVTYVHVYDYTPDVAYIGYTPGYTCSYVYGGTVVYGTGYYYRPWYGHHYYPRPVTWGYGVHWNQYSGWDFSFGIRYGGPYGWFRIGWGYPYGYWGPRGYWGGYRRGYRHGYRRGAGHAFAAGYGAGHYQAGSSNLYKNRSSGVRRTGEVRTADKRPAAPSSTIVKQRQTGRSRNDAYADRKGNVYRRNKGNWERLGGSRAGGKAAQRPGRASRQDLIRYQKAREKAARSNERYQRLKSTVRRGTDQQPSAKREARPGSAGQKSVRQGGSDRKEARRTVSGKEKARSKSGARRKRR